MSNSRTKNTVLNSIFGIFVKVVTLLSAFIVRTIFIKVLGIQYAGVQGVFSDVLMMLSFAELGIGSAITYALYKPIAENDELQIGKLMRAYRNIYTLIAFVVLVLGIILTPFLDYIIHDVPDIKESIQLIFLLYVLNSATSYLLIYKSTFLTAAQKDYLVSKYRIAITILRSLIECVLLLIFGNFILYLLVGICFNFLQNYIVAKVAEREYPVLRKKNTAKLEPKEKQGLFANVRALFLYKVSGVVLNGTDSVVTSTILGTAYVGLLGNYYLISNQLYSFFMQIFSASSASIGNLAATSTGEYQLQIFRKMMFFCFWIYCVTATCLFVVFQPFLMLWLGKDYLLSNYVVAAIVFEYYIRGMLSPISQFRHSNGLFVQGKYRPLIMAVLNIVISIFLALKIGLLGIILGTILSRALTQLWYDPWLIYRLVFHKSVQSYYIMYLKQLLTLGLSCLIALLLYNSLVCENLWMNFITATCIAFAVPNLLVALFYCKTTEFNQIRLLLFNLVKRKI